MSIWRFEREVENIKIEIERYEKLMNEKQDDFQRATRRGDEVKARQDRREQLVIGSRIRELTRELILAERRLMHAREMEANTSTDDLEFRDHG